MVAEESTKAMKYNSHIREYYILHLGNNKMKVDKVKKSFYNCG